MKSTSSLTGGTGCLCLACTIACFAMSQSMALIYGAIGPVGDAVQKCDALQELVQSSSRGLVEVELARMNLLCAERASGAEKMDVPACLFRLEEWAKRVRVETERHQYRYKHNPSEIENSEGFYKMLMIAVVLAEDFGVRYSSERRIDPSAASANDKFFADSRDVFLHGLLGPERRGTCSSLPVLYVAIGRQLSYPLKLVTTKGHLFVRWEGAGERFNIEAAGNGLNRFDDDYYRRWPFAITSEEEKAEGYLQSLNPSGELAVFLSIRVQCLRAAQRFKEALDAQEQVCRLMPKSRIQPELLEQLKRDVREDRLATPQSSRVPENATKKTQPKP